MSEIGRAAGDALYAPTKQVTEYYPSAAPQPDITDRKVITNSYVNAVVSNVSESVNKIKTETQSLGGYVVNSYVEKDESAETGLVSVKVPSAELDGFLNFLRQSAVKISRENIEGQHKTRRNELCRGQNNRLEQTIARLEEIQATAVKVEDIISIQNQIFNLKDRVDSYKGQLKYYDGASATTLISINLSTDEFSLPYTEPLSWRPEVVFKHAVRALVFVLQDLGTLVIWAVVFSVIWLPALVIFILLIKWFNKRVISNPNPMQ